MSKEMTFTIMMKTMPFHTPSCTAELHVYERIPNIRRRIPFHVLASTGREFGTARLQHAERNKMERTTTESNQRPQLVQPPLALV